MKYKSLILFIGIASLLWVSAVDAATITRGPYLQQGSSDSVIIKWTTETSTESKVYLDEISTSTFTSNQEVFSDSTPTTDHTAYITGLNPLTKYYYGVELGNADNTQFFTTSPIKGTSSLTRIWVIGDAGMKNQKQEDVYNSYIAYTGDIETGLWLNLGDNAYNHGKMNEYQEALFDAYPDLLKQVTFWPAIGNHDTESKAKEQSGPYFDIFDLPKNAEVGGEASGTEAYYSFDYGNIHIVVLDSYVLGSKVGTKVTNMKTWLAADLAANSSEWLIAFWHHPPYSKGAHDSESEIDMVTMREIFVPVLEENGVDLVLTGHNHFYSRSKLISCYSGEKDSCRFGSYNSSEICIDCNEYNAYTKSGGAGTVYAVVGASSQTTKPCVHPVMNVTEEKIGSMVIDVDGPIMKVKYLGVSGTGTGYVTGTQNAIATAVVLDSFTITKNTVAPAVPSIPTDLSASLDASNNITLTWIDESDNETGFMIERKLSSSENWTDVTTTASNVIQFTDTGLLANTSYSYRIKAVDRNKASSYTDVVTLSTNNITKGTLVLQNGSHGYTAMQDSYIANGSSVQTENWGDSQELAADGDSNNGELVALLKWDLSGQLPADSVVTAAEINVQVSNPGGVYNVYAMTASWEQSSVTWANSQASFDQVIVGSFKPDSTGNQTINLNQQGIVLLQSWLDGSANYGFMIKSAGTEDGVDLRSSEYTEVSMRPALSIDYTDTFTPDEPEDATLPQKPTELIAVSVGSSQVSLTWSDNSNNETGFRVERSDDNGLTWSEINSNLASDISLFTDNNISEGTDYQYRVYAFNELGGSDFSNELLVSSLSNTPSGEGSITFQNGVSSYNGASDSYISSQHSEDSYGNAENLRADGSDGSNGELVALMKWDISDIPDDAEVTSASITFNVINRSDNAYGIFLMQHAWEASGVSWNSVAMDAEVGNNYLDSFEPLLFQEYVVDLPIDVVQSWLTGENNGIYIRSLGTTDGIKIDSSKVSSESLHPKLTVTYE